MAVSERALPGRIGRYRVVRLLGQGAMGRVLLAHDSVLDRDVAVKLLRNDLGLPPEQSEALVERMRQEARASARVSHPNIVALYDMGEDAGHGLFLVFEYVEGWSLKEKLARGPIGLDAAVRLALELGSALATAHAAGVLHRDIKPENIILARTGAKIADFGIARVPDSTLTRGGKLLGTPAYSAPEAVAHGTFSSASDQFSMAATLYEAISLRRAFPGEDAVTVATRITTEQPTPVAELCSLDLHVDAVLYRALSKDPGTRFPSCDDFGRALAEALTLTPRTRMNTLPDVYHQRSRRAGAPSRTVWVALGSAVLGALVTVGVADLVVDHPRETVGSASGRDGSEPTASEEAVAWLAPRPPPAAAPAPAPAPVERSSKPPPSSPADSPRDAGTVVPPTEAPSPPPPEPVEAGAPDNDVAEATE
ncbi:MAG: serine/threonine protein kinase [Polyangiaceae bacterium]|nr:serine/threonine protein kinase [Polyangiaceae bacterium]